MPASFPTLQTTKLLTILITLAISWGCQAQTPRGNMDSQGIASTTSAPSAEAHRPASPPASQNEFFSNDKPPLVPPSGEMQTSLDSSLLKYSYSSCKVSGPFVALTFDDGPHPELTPKLLDLLKKRGIVATFYVIGKNAAAYPEIIQRMAAEGHEIANHSWSHPPLNRVSSARLTAELEKTSRLIEQLTGKPPATIRPPYGATNARLNRLFREQFQMTSVLWDVDPQDWKYRNSTRVARQILENTKPGSIILAHDIHATTIAAIPAVLDGLLQKGFRFVTVKALLEMDQKTELAEAAMRAEKTSQPSSSSEF